MLFRSAEPARRLLTDEVLQDVLLIGSPAEVGMALGDLVTVHGPSSIGLALLQEDLAAGIEAAAEAFVVMHASLAVPS